MGWVDIEFGVLWSEVTPLHTILCSPILQAQAAARISKSA